MARVAVVTPCRDVAPYLGAAITSVLGQTLRDLEYVVVDDGSCDASTAIAGAVRDDRMRTIRHASSRGVAAARDTGIAATHAPLVAFLDGDDVWDPQFLSVLVDTLERRPDCLAAFAWSRIVDESGSPTGELIAPRAGRYDLGAMLAGICPPGNGSCLVIRRAALVGNTVAAPQGSDAETWLRMLAHVPSGYFHCEPRVLVRYRRRRGALTSGSQRARIASLARRLATYGGDRVTHAAFARYGHRLGHGHDPRVRAWLAEARRAPLRERFGSLAGLELELLAWLGHTKGVRS